MVGVCRLQTSTKARAGVGTKKDPTTTTWYCLKSEATHHVTGGVAMNASPLSAYLPHGTGYSVLIVTLASIVVASLAPASSPETLGNK